MVINRGASDHGTYSESQDTVIGHLSQSMNFLKYNSSQDGQKFIAEQT